MGAAVQRRAAGERGDGPGSSSRPHHRDCRRLVPKPARRSRPQRGLTSKDRPAPLVTSAELSDRAARDISRPSVTPNHQRGRCRRRANLRCQRSRRVGAVRRDHVRPPAGHPRRKLRRQRSPVPSPGPTRRRPALEADLLREQSSDRPADLPQARRTSPRRCRERSFRSSHLATPP